MEIVFFDTETTGKDAEDRIIQLAYIHSKNGEDTSTFLNELFLAPLPVKIEAMAIHHITNRMLEGKDTFEASPQFDDIRMLFHSDNTICVAHNAKFDVLMLEKEGVKPKHVIDTLRVARFLDPTGFFKSYSLQYLRYALDLEVEATAHDALGDVRVLSALFARLFTKLELQMTEEKVPFLTKDDVLTRMEQISAEPSLLVRFSFGMHVGKKIADVAKTKPDYLQWMLKTKLAEADQDEDMIHTLRYYLRPSNETASSPKS